MRSIAIVVGKYINIEWGQVTHFNKVTYSLNCLGQVTAITDAAGTRSRSIASDGRLLSETYATGLLSGTSVTHGYDALLRRETFSTGTAGPSFTITSGYDSASRLATITSGADTTTYTYGKPPV
jgi:hypothetical protein